MRYRYLMLFFFSLLLFSATEAQDFLESFNDTAVISKEEAPANAAPIMAKKWNQIKTKFFTLNFGVAVFLDYNIVDQNNGNIEQVGKIDNAVEFRAERLIFSGTVGGGKHPWRYMISGNYNGLDGADATSAFSVIDLNFEIPFGDKGGWLTVGKQKEGVGHEYVAPGSQLSFTERASGVPALIKQRNFGFRYSNSILNHRLTYTLGLFNNWIEKGNKNSFADNGIQVTSRITALPIYTSDANLMHVGIGWRYTDAGGDKISYKAKPEANTAPSFINTGSFDASAANTLMLEWIGVKGAFSAIGEYMQAFVSSKSMGNPTFHYYQFGGSWFITGEHRNYNKQTGNLGKLIPKKIFRLRKGGGPGAFELATRYTKSNFTDNGIDGGKFGRITAAVGWFPNAHLRYEINYGYGKLDKGNINGNANFWQFRVQFEL